MTLSKGIVQCESDLRLGDEEPRTDRLAATISSRDRSWTMLNAKSPSKGPPLGLTSGYVPFLLSLIWLMTQTYTCTFCGNALPRCVICLTQVESKFKAGPGLDEDFLPTGNEATGRYSTRCLDPLLLGLTRQIPLTLPMWRVKHVVTEVSDLT